MATISRTDLGRADALDGLRPVLIVDREAEWGSSGTCVVCGETVGDDDEPSDTFEPDTVAEARGDK